MNLATKVGSIGRDDAITGLAASAVLAFLLVWVVLSGGYGGGVWYPSALGMTSLAILTGIAVGRVLPATRPARAALLAFAALVALNYVSIAWARNQGAALDAANQLALYLSAAWILAVLPWTAPRLMLLLGIWSIGVATICAVVMVDATEARTLTAYFIDMRFASPMQYSNATGALAAMAMLPSLVLSSRRELPAWVRGLALGLGSFLVMYAALPASRATLLGMILAAPVVVAVISDRFRATVRIVAVAGAAAAFLPQVVRIDTAVEAGADVTPLLRHAAVVMLVIAVAAAVLGLLVGLLEDRLDRRPRVAEPATSIGPETRRRLLLAAAGVVLAAVIVGAVLIEPHVVRLVHRTVQEGDHDASTGTDRFLSTSPEERFDYYRVAILLFRAHPIAGIGAANFGARYDALRRFVKHSQYVHDLPLRVLCETGALGEILFLTTIVSLLVGVVAVARRRDDLTRACLATAFAVSTYFLVHSCLDWVDEFPALAVPAIGFPLASLSLGREPAGMAASARRVAIGAGQTAVAVATAGIVVLVAGAYLSQIYVNRAFSVFREDPGGAYADLRDARSLDPVDANPWTSEGTIALYAGDPGRAEAAFRRSISMQDDWYSRFELALLLARARQYRPAALQLSAARALDADDPVLTTTLAAVRARRHIDPFTVNDALGDEGDSTASIQETIR